MANGEATLEYTPTWVVALVCAVIVLISLAAEKFLVVTDKYLKRNMKAMFEALHKIKQELLLGILSLLLTLFQDHIGKICITEKLASRWVPCQKHAPSSTAADSSNSNGYCSKGKVPLLSSTAWNNLQIFIFVVASMHGTFSVLTIVFAKAKIRKWKHWEDYIHTMDYMPEEVSRHPYLFRKKNSALTVWLLAFAKQFKGSVSKEDYMAMRHGFLTDHCRPGIIFDFSKYMQRVGEEDFKRVVGIRWYLWFYAVVFLLVNARGWHAYFWIAWIPFILLLVVGTKLEHAMAQVVCDVAERHNATQRNLVIERSDDYFWFDRPTLVLFLIHVIVFQNSFQLAFLLWVWVQYSLHSCIMGNVGYIIPRLVIGVFVQFACSYNVFPLYLILSQMGNRFNLAGLDNATSQAFSSWFQSARRRRRREPANGSHQEDSEALSVIHELAEVGNEESLVEDATAAGEIEPALPVMDQNDKTVARSWSRPNV